MADLNFDLETDDLENDIDTMYQQSIQTKSPKSPAPFKKQLMGLDKLCNKTILEKYGSKEDYSNFIRIISQEKCIEKYGVENVFQLDCIKMKSKKTMLDKYGVEHALQNLKLFENYNEDKAKEFFFERLDGCYQVRYDK